MITIPRAFRIDENEQQETWSVKLNEFVRDCIKGFTKANDQATFVDVPFRGGATDVKVLTKFPVPVRGVIVINVEDEDTGALTPGAVWAQTAFLRGELVLRQVTGLTAGVNYRLRLQLIGA